MNRDLANKLDAVTSIAPQTASGGVNGTGVDLKGCDSVMFAVGVGSITGAAGDAAVTIEESDDNSAWAAAAAKDVSRSASGLVADTATQIGYIGSKRYARAVFDLGGETNVQISAVAIRGHLARAPSEIS